MSHARYASITADLLARKGDAKPWQPPREMIAPERTPEPPPFVSEPAPHEMAHDVARDLPHEAAHESHDTSRRCTLRLSECEYQRLGIVAVKKDTTRQQILRQAVEHYLAAAEAEYGRGCGCLSGQGCSR